MFYKKPLLVKKTNTYKISYSAFESNMDSETDPNLMSHKKARITYNFDTKDGCLKQGKGFKYATLPTGVAYPSATLTLSQLSFAIKKMWQYKYYDESTGERKDRIMAYCDDKYLRWKLIKSNDETFYALSATKYNSMPNIINYRNGNNDSMIITSSGTGMQLFTPPQTMTSIENGYKIRSMCVHYERCFAIVEGERIRLAFSATLNPTNWDATLSDGGFIDMPDDLGAMNQLFSFNDYVYIFRDYGISRLSGYADQTEFVVSKLYNSSMPIYGETVANCGDKFVFLDKQSLNIFNGVSVTKLKLGIENLFAPNNQNAVACYHNGKYYLACKMIFDDGETIDCESNSSHKNNALLELDLETGKFNITRGIDIKNMLVLKYEDISKILFCFNTVYPTCIGEFSDNGKFFDFDIKKKWQSPKSNLGYANHKKIVKQIVIKSLSDCTIKIATDIETKTYQVKGKQVTQKIKTHAIGELVQLTIESTANPIDISVPEMIFTVI